MKRLVIILGLLVFIGLLAACSSGGGNVAGGDDGEDGLPLKILFVVASPDEGTEPLRTTLTAVITGGKAPFYYAWDFTSDGSPDFYDNGQYSRTVNIEHDFFLDPLTSGQSFETKVSLKVSDSEETTKPVYWGLIPEDEDIDPALWGTIPDEESTSIKVLPEGGLTVKNSWTSNTAEGHVDSGEPILFSVAAAGGQSPYTYGWDFNGDGGADSSLQNPQHTFYNTNTIPGNVVEYRIGVTIKDANGEMLGENRSFFSDVAGSVYDVEDLLSLEPDDPFQKWDIVDGVLYTTVNVIVPSVPGEPVDPDPVDQGFEIIVNSDPPAGPGTPYPVIELKYNPDPTPAQIGQVPLEPELDLSVVVDPINGGGIQPFEYYWDFDNDGSMESQAPSPSVPFYDFSRKILVNTYIHSLDSKVFTLRCMVIDGSGRIENVFRTVIVQNTSNFSGDLVVVPQYGVLLGDGTMGDPFGAVLDTDNDQDIRDELTDVVFTFNISGSTGEYDYQFDADGDGEIDLPVGGGFEPIIGSVLRIDSSVPDTLAPFQGVGYFLAKIVIRSLQNGAPAQSATINMPLSLVGRQSLLIEGDLEKRFGHTVEASWVTAADDAGAVANGEHLVSRELIIVAGAVGNTPLRSVEKVFEDYLTPPAAAGEIEVPEPMVAVNRIPILHPRKGAMMWTEDTNYYVHGGEGVNNEIIPWTEAIPIDDNGGATPWTELSGIAGYFPLKYAMGTRVTDLSTDVLPYGLGSIPASQFDALMFCGGITLRQDPEIEETSPLTFFYRSVAASPPSWAPVDADPMSPPNPDSYEPLSSLMITPRHEGCLVWDPDDRLLYALGGRVASGVSTATVEVLNIDTKQWLNLPPMNNARAGGVAEYINGQIYIMGGSNYPEDEGSRVVLETAEVFDPDTGIWSQTLPPLNPTHQPGAALLPGPGSVSDNGVNLNTIWYFGGSTDLGETNVFEEFVYFHDVALPEPPPET